VPERLRSEFGPAVTVTAHAGCLDTAANTPESFRAALAFPVDYLEADVRFTPENVPYLAHDALAAPLREKAMSLADLLRLVAPHPGVRLNLDMKEYSGIAIVGELVTRSGIRSRVLLTGITADVAGRVREEGDGLPYLLNARPSLKERLTDAGAAELARRIRESGARGLNVHHRLLTARLARRLRAAGLSVSVWTVDEVARMRRMMRLSVDNITTRRIDTLLALRNGEAR
jgi:glycerophosphoryl diester phosphodiesterase